MRNIFYRVLMVLSKLFGVWFFILVSRMVSTGFFLFFPGRRAVSIAFYKALFPEKNGFFHITCAWKQYHRFTYTFLDRFLYHDLNRITYTSEGTEHIDNLKNSGKGGILLMSHLGNWEIAANFLKDYGLRLLLYMGRKHKEQIEGMQKDSLVRTGIKIVAVDSEENSPLAVLDAISHLKSGGIVSLTGDRMWSEKQRTVQVNFLGHEAKLPEAPYLMALLARTPLYIFFAFRTGRNHYHLSISPPIFIEDPKHRKREEIVATTAQLYADTLETYLRQHPYDWYHFEPFLIQKTDQRP